MALLAVTHLADKTEGRMVAVMKHWSNFCKNERGYAVVEATILFPIIIMVFAGLVLLAMYLPTRSALQEATQFAATAIATERADTWLYYDEDSEEFRTYSYSEDLPNVYISLFQSVLSGDETEKALKIVEKKEDLSMMTPPGNLEVEFGVVNYILYKEIIVTATRKIPMPVNLSFVNFPTEIPITVTSTAVIQNGDEFVRNIDLAKDFLEYLDERYNIGEAFSKVTEVGEKIAGFLGI